MRKNAAITAFILWLVASVTSGVIGFGAMVRALSPGMDGWDTVTPTNWIGLGFAVLGLVFQTLFLALLVWLALQFRARSAAAAQPAADPRP